MLTPNYKIHLNNDLVQYGLKFKLTYSVMLIIHQETKVWTNLS